MTATIGYLQYLYFDGNKCYVNAEDKLSITIPKGATDEEIIDLVNGYCQKKQIDIPGQDFLKNCVIEGLKSKYRRELAGKEQVAKGRTAGAEGESKHEVFKQKYSNGRLYEAVLIAGKPCFLVAGPDSMEIKDQIELDDQVIRPLEPSMYINRAYSFSSKEEVDAYIDRAKNEILDSQYLRVKAVWQKYIDADDFHLSICAADTVYSYYQDKIGLTHYVFFVGNNSSGKSNNLRVFQQLAYRNMTSTDVTSANIYQFLGSDEEGQGTLCEDEADNIDDDREKMRIYKQGYTTGFPVLRTDTSYGRRQYAFNTFCFKAFAAERLPDGVKAKGFNQRVIEIPCFYGFPKYDITEVINPAGVEEYQTLLDELNETRNTLLIYRLLHYHEQIPQVQLNIDGRENQLFSPLIRVFKESQAVKGLLPIISRYVGQKRESNANTLHAFLYKIVRQLIEAQNTVELESTLIWNTVKGTLQGSEDKQSYDSVEFGIISQREIVQILKDVFGAKKSRKHGEGRTLVFDVTKLDRLGKIYDLDIEIQVIEGEPLEPHVPLVGIGQYLSDDEQAAERHTENDGGPEKAVQEVQVEQVQQPTQSNTEALNT